ncbi:unnamed protein product [Parnassius apollo]|uniref:(apollo) hypothetical protein n=1 Tax=Parnassius apollo TaxID=110799 RepID=A0A8S3WWU3_PARAO|nr:unnamed protein product [Parnassius apollo]
MPSKLRILSIRLYKNVNIASKNAELAIGSHPLAPELPEMRLPSPHVKKPQGVSAGENVTLSRDAVVRSRDAGVRSRDAGVRSRDAGVRSRDAGVRSRDAGVRSRDAGVRSRDAGVRSRDAVVRSFDAEARSRGAVMRSRDAVASSRDAVTSLTSDSECWDSLASCSIALRFLSSSSALQKTLF